MESNATAGLPINRKSARTDSGFWRWMVLGSVLANTILNYWNNVDPLNGKTNGEISDQYHSLFTPAGYTFSIWGLIFLSLIIYAIYQLLPAQRDAGVYDRLARPFVLTNILSIVWVVLFSFEALGWSTLIIALMLVTSLVLLVRSHAISATSSASSFVTVPFSLYSGWLTVATIAAVSLWLTSLDWDGGPLSPSAWAIILVLIAGAIGIFVTARLRDLIYGLVIVWGLTGIYSSQTTDTSEVATAALAVAAILFILALVLKFRRPKSTAF